MEIKVREAVIKDYESLCEVYVELDEQHRLNHPELFILPEDYAKAKEYLLESINDSNKGLFVAEADSKVVGFAECYLQKSSNFPIIKKREWIQLDGIAVREGYQKHGIGRLLLRRVIEWAKNKDVDRIELKVYSFNSNAEQFYARNGFRELSKAMYLNIRN
ncbi:sortase [Desulfosporosinus sp. HMP52]|uniref:GNAT family N-acetyltransferase n=1 Tax=Desulfosporosinus sp. HMP52 TaxID=1487923 RepID=UPI00051FBD0D|nr:GNAT family N-acetyltransferase [Desulfosporosinus sp. HMP52]KGK88103.1 sortase [Desulfosporosinus sp. HMP52]